MRLQKATSALLHLCPSLLEFAWKCTKRHRIEASTGPYRRTSALIIYYTMGGVNTQQGASSLRAIHDGNLTGVVCFVANKVLTGLCLPCAYRYLPAAKPYQPYRRSPARHFCNHLTVLTPRIGRNLLRHCVIYSEVGQRRAKKADVSV